MAKLTLEQIKEKIFQNSLETCEYISGYENAQSTIKVKCLIHNYEFETKYENVRRDNRKHHICPYCQQDDKDSKKNVSICAYCQKRFYQSLSKVQQSKSGLVFCCREHKDLAQRLDSGEKFNQLRPEHYSRQTSTINTYRDYAFRNYSHCCAVCGYDEDIDILQVHHIDENRQNNELENLIILCPNCHAKLTIHKYKLINRKDLILN